MIETAAQRIMESGILGALLVGSCGALVYLFKLRESDRKDFQGRIDQLQAEKVAMLKETLQRDNDHFSTVQKVLDVVRPGA